MYSYIKTVPDSTGYAGRIVVVPDVHQDLDKAKRCLLLASVIDRAGNWVGASTVVVQMGDQIDGANRGHRLVPRTHVCHADLARDVEVLTFFNDLHSKATRQGGAVYSLIGNHELMNVMGSFDYADTYGCGECERKRREAFAPGGPVAMLLGTTRVVCLKIGRIVFVHAGILPFHARAMDLRALNKTMTDTFLGNPVRPADEKMFQRMCVDYDGILTNRFFMPGMHASEQDTRAALKMLDADHMVIGHNAHAGGVTALHGGLVYVCDPGISKSVLNSSPKVLEISQRRESYRPEFSVLAESGRT